MPPLLTCLVGMRLCEKPNEDHWRLRDFAASLLSIVCKKYGASYHTLQPRIVKTLLMAFLDTQKPLTTHYGAIAGLIALGENTVQLTLLEPSKNSNLVAYTKLLELELKTATDPIKKQELLRCFGLLQSVAINYLAKQAANFRITADEEKQQQQHHHHHHHSHHSGTDPASEIARTMQKNISALPKDMHSRYEELFELFGEALVPANIYRIHSATSLECEISI